MEHYWIVRWDLSEPQTVETVPHPFDSRGPGVARLLDAAERVAAGTAIHWADLTVELGCADQAHFIRDFKKLVGRSPAEYARSIR